MKKAFLKNVGVGLGVLVLAVGVTYILFEVFHVGSVDLPLAETVAESSLEHPDQNWKSGWLAGQTQWFHHAPQGTKILPYDWFMALERPEISPFRVPERIAEGNYLEQLGFLPSQRDQDYNPDGLPIGFAKEDNFPDPTAVDKKPYSVVGLTCAACHTGQINYKDKNGSLRAVRIEGGPAMINIALFQRAIGLALFYTDFFEARFSRFSRRVLKQDYTQANRDRLRAELKEFLNNNLTSLAYAEKKGINKLELGFARTDALGLIGNRVFGPLDVENLTVANAPVNFPQLWDTAWFDWVQYNASIRMPMVRNIGEALGVGAVVKLDVDKADRFPSSVNVQNLHLMEDQLGGGRPFAGLRSPKWSDTRLPPIDPVLSGRGKSLYATFCQGCHHPPMQELEADLKSENPRFWTQDGPIRVLELKVIDLQQIGTDPNQALNFYRRLSYVEGNTVSAAKGLYNVTGFIRKRFYQARHLDAEQILAYDRSRSFDDPRIDRGEFDFDHDEVISKVIVARLGYKARPLNGIWATAPYLHNGSVPNLYQVLVPVKQRDRTFYLGTKMFDPARVGFRTETLPGGFKLDTSLSGNTNTGHEFRNLELKELESALGRGGGSVAACSINERWAQLLGMSVADWEGLSDDGRWQKIRDLTWEVLQKNWYVAKGVIGPELSDTQRWELVEYLKSL